MERRRPSRCFNPLPSQKQGETEMLHFSGDLLSVSIRSPHKSKGRHSCTAAKGRARLVSIRSPHKSKGRHHSRERNALKSRFQSAPLTKARGDRSPCRRVARPRCFNPLPSQKQGETYTALAPDLQVLVSIRSPHKSKGRRQLSELRAVYMQVSIRSPHKSKGRRSPNPPRLEWSTSFNPLPSQKQGETSARAYRARAATCFNPLPSQKQGETLRLVLFSQAIRVSIRSPHKSKGRLDQAQGLLPADQFQSAPLTKARGDAAR